MMASYAPTQDEVQVFFGNSHSHSALSDGWDTPARAHEHASDVARPFGDYGARLRKICMSDATPMATNQYSVHRL